MPFYFKSIILSSNTGRLRTASVWRTVPNQLSATAYSTLSKLPLTSAGRFLHPESFGEGKISCPYWESKNDFSVDSSYSSVYTDYATLAPNGKNNNSANALIHCNENS